MTKLVVNEIMAIGEAVTLTAEGVEIEVGSTDKTALLLNASGDEEIIVKAGSTVLGSTEDLSLTAPAGVAVLNVDGKFASGDKVTICGPDTVSVQIIVLP